MRRGLRSSALVVAAAVLTLTAACGAQEAGSAAVVGERRITQSDLQQATQQVQQFFDAQAQTSGGQPQPVDQRQVLSILVAAPFITDAAQKAGAGTSENDARDIIVASVPEPAPSTLDYVRASVALNRLGALGQEQGQQAINTAITAINEAQPRINPRYGQWDSERITITDTRPNWLPSPTPSPSPGAPQPGDEQGAEPGTEQPQPPAASPTATP
jgi:hypothetical protein